MRGAQEGKVYLVEIRGLTLARAGGWASKDYQNDRTVPCQGALLSNYEWRMDKCSSSSQTDDASAIRTHGLAVLEQYPGRQADYRAGADPDRDRGV